VPFRPFPKGLEHKSQGFRQRICTGPAGLKFDINIEIRQEGFENLLQQGKSAMGELRILPGARIKVPYLIPGTVLYGAVQAGGPHERIIMEHHEFAAFTKVDVELKAGSA
jgi:hypothetical protein